MSSFVTGTLGWVFFGNSAGREGRDGDIRDLWPKIDFLKCGRFSRSPYSLLFLMAAVTFVAELLIMSVFFETDALHNFFDAVLITAVVFICAWFIMARPLQKTLDELEERERLLQSVFVNLPAGMMLTDARPSIVAVNRAFSEITGYDPDDAIGRNPRLLSSGRHDEAFYKGVWRSIEEEGYWCGDVWNRHKDGSVYLERLRISAIHNRKGKPLYYVGLLTDITREYKAQQDTVRRATHDALTDLPNRILLQDRLEQSIQRAQRSGDRFAVLLIDLDGFKPVNDEYGHLAGDQVLQEIARRLKAQLRVTDTAARLGGDEFVVIVSDVGERDADLAAATKLLRALSAPIKISNGTVMIGASIGMALYPDHGADIETLLARADSAMYEAKRTGKNRIVLA